jgi:hypothetical protein
MSPGAMITGSGQIEWSESLLLGDGTDLFVSSLTGWDELPGLDSGNVPRSQTHGSWAGRQLAQERVVTVEFDILPSEFDTTALRDLLRRTTSIDPNGVEHALVVRTDAGPPLLAYGQVVRRSIPLERDFRRRINGGAIQWACSDPRRYSVSPIQVTVGAAMAGTGYTFPLNYPIDYGVPTVPGVVPVINDGTAPTPPVITLQGPVTRPRVINQTSGDVLEFDIELAANDQLVINVGAGTVTLGGATRISTMTTFSTPPSAFEIPPGTTTLAFRGQSFEDPGATMTVLWRPATW